MPKSHASLLAVLSSAIESCLEIFPDESLSTPIVKYSIFSFTKSLKSNLLCSKNSLYFVNSKLV